MMYEVYRQEGLAIANVIAYLQVLALDHLNLNKKYYGFGAVRGFTGIYSAKLTLLKGGGNKNMWFGGKK